MAVPAEVREVPRPKNTVVIASNTGRYAVRSRLGCKYSVDEDGKRHRTPVNGPVIGYIENGVYTALEDHIPALGAGDVDVKDWANVVLCDSRCKDILEDLKGFYNETDARTIYTVAMLRCCYEGTSDRLLERQYQETYLTELYPNLNLGKNAICDLLRNLGRECGRISRFMRMRTDTLEPDDMAIVDGTLKVNDSTVNSYSAKTRKSHLNNRDHMMVMYAYSLRRREPICSKPYSGTITDRRAIRDFVESVDLERGVIVADRGFPPNIVKEAVEGRPGLHWLLPLTKNSRMIERYDLRSYDDRLEGEDGIQCRRVRGTDDNGNTIWLYSFRTPHYAAEEELRYMLSHTGKDFDPKELEEIRPSFGTIVFESDLEMESATAYSIYESRWMIELFFKFDKDELDLDGVREHSDYSVTGSAFIDFLAALMGTRILNFLESRGALDDMTYGDVKRALRRLKATDSGTGGWRLSRVPKVEAEMAERLGLIERPVVPKEHKARGRPKGSKDKVPRKRKSTIKDAQSSD